LFREYIHVEYEHTRIIYRVNQAEYAIHIRVVAPQEYVNLYSTRWLSTHRKDNTRTPTTKLTYESTLGLPIPDQPSHESYRPPLYSLPFPLFTSNHLLFTEGRGLDGGGACQLTLYIPQPVRVGGLGLGLGLGLRV